MRAGEQDARRARAVRVPERGPEPLDHAARRAEPGRPGEDKVFKKVITLEIYNRVD